MKKHTLHLGVLLALVMLLVTMSVPAFAETGDVEINAINFPDAKASTTACGSSVLMLSH